MNETKDKGLHWRRRVKYNSLGLFLPLPLPHSLSNIIISEAPSRRLRLFKKHSFTCKDQEEPLGLDMSRLGPVLPLTGHKAWQ